jgi:cell division protein FtsQ
MKKIIIISLWAIFGAGLIFLTTFATRTHNNLLSSKPDIKIERQNGDMFIREDDVIKMLQDHDKYPEGKSIAAIHADELEKLLLTHPAVESCDVFVSVGGQVSIKIRQRKTIARMTNLAGESYYFDSNGKLMPWSDEYTSPVLFVNGYFMENYASMYNRSFESYTADSALNTPLLIDDIWQISKRIEADTFLRAQIVQVYVTPEKQFQLIPRVGDHVINLGDISDLDAKLDKLKTFYFDGLNHTGSWADYAFIDLQYKNQIVCTKKNKPNGI